MHGDKIGREQVWKWKSAGQVQTSQDVGGDCENGGEERSRRWKDAVSFPGWKVSPPSPGSMDCPWLSVRPGPGVELVVPGEDSCSLRCPSVGRHAPPAPRSCTCEPGFMDI